MKILAKKPPNGGTPATEKKIRTKEKAHNLFILKSPFKLEIKNESLILK